MLSFGCTFFLCLPQRLFQLHVVSMLALCGSHEMIMWTVLPVFLHCVLFASVANNLKA
jgi:hypothetical protein